MRWWPHLESHPVQYWICSGAIVSSTGSIVNRVQLSIMTSWPPYKASISEQRRLQHKRLNDETFIWHLLWVCSVTHVPSTNMEGSGFTTVSAASHQGAIGSFLIHFRRAVMSSIFIYSQWCNTNMCINLNSWHLLAVTWLVFTAEILKYIRPGSEISHWHSLLSAGSNTVIVSCMDVGDFTFASALCFDSILCVFNAAQSVMWIWMGFVQRLDCQGENDPDWQRDDLL